MKLDMLEFQLNEEKVNNPIKDLTTRVKELRSLNNSANEICKKIATEFGKDYDDVKRYLLPIDLKRYVGMSVDELNKVGEVKIKELRKKYNKFVSNTTSRATFLRSLMDAYIKG